MATTRTVSLRLLFRCAALVPLLAWPGCGGSHPSTQGSGGALASGGTTPSGGISGTGGMVSSGGSSGRDGSIAEGGTTATGGAGSGGATVGSGGAADTDGGSVAATGGAAVTGGRIGSGGAVGSGGITVSTGGRAGSGGAALGGVTGTGGVATGGRTGTGGVTSSGGSGGTTGTGGTSSGKRLGGACEPGTSYAAPVLTGAPKLVSRAASTASGTYEGPVWLGADSVLLFSDVTFTTPVNPAQILKLVPPSTVGTYLADSGTNGMAVDASGVVVACSHKVQGLVKLDYAAGTLTTLVDNYGGKKFNSPNDLVVRSDGTIYFTDPDYQLGNRTSETGKKGIYRVSPTGTVSLVDDTFNEPNGITLSPDEMVLYVADYAGNAVRTFAVAADGSTSSRKSFVSVPSPDGFALDCLGNLYVASGSPGSMEVYSPAGAKLGSITVAASTSNAAFGGADGKTLYITAGKALYSLDLNLPGYYY